MGEMIGIIVAFEFERKPTARLAELRRSPVMRSSPPRVRTLDAFDLGCETANSD